MKEEPNILFILIDALRASNLGCYGYQKQTSPNLDNLAREGVLFEKAFSCATTTHPSLTSIFSGKYPVSHGITKHEPTLIPQDIQRLNESGTVLLPEIMKSNGYVTLAVDWLGRWHRKGYDYYSGALSPKKLKLYSMIEKLVKLEKLAAYLAHTKLIDHAKVVTDKAIHLIKKVHGRKFFLFLHYWDTHVPYNPPKDYCERFLHTDYGEDKSMEEVLAEFDPEYSKRYFKNFQRILGRVKGTNEVLARYDGAIAYVDTQLHRLTETLEEFGISERTLIVVTSDHGESLKEHGIYFGHHGLYDVTVHVPLIFRFSEFPSRKRVKGFVQHTDIVPTILDILGMKAKSPTLDGKNLIPLINQEVEQLRDAVYIEEADFEWKRAMRTADYKYIYAPSEKDAVCKACGRVHGGIKELYDLKKDPGETENTVEEDPDIANRLQGRLSEWVKILAGNRQKGLVGKETPHDTFEEEIVRERLKALGYF